ncbi:MAG: hypothetical protein KQI78_05290 [Deltaproteobacteria bacterium]|nr:hypothetical protein [Deltaproteobacteria bacterium]
MNPKTNTDITPRPSSVLEAAQILIKKLPFKDRVAISKMSMKEVALSPAVSGSKASRGKGKEGKYAFL